MRCPNCKDEYEDGYTVCADCNIELIQDHEDINESEATDKDELLEKLPFAEILQNSNFKIQSENDYFLAKHENVPEICIIPFEEGHIFEIWQHNDKENIDYSLINQLNNDNMAVRILFNQQEKMFVIDSCFFGEFSPQSFAGFFNLFLNEVKKILSSEIFNRN